MLPNIKRGSGIGKTVQVAFGGLDLRPEARDGTFRTTQNMTADRFPLLTVRDKRKQMTVSGNTPKAILGMGDALISWFDGDLYYNDFILCTTAADSVPHLVPFGRTVVIPETRELVNLTYPLKGHVVSQAALPANPAEGDAYLVGEGVAPHVFVRQGNAWEDVGPVIKGLETSVTLDEFKCEFLRVGSYQEEEAEWNTIRVPSTAGDLRERFKPGDAVTISGCTAQPQNNQTIIVREVGRQELRFYENSFQQAYLWQHEVINGSGGCEFSTSEQYEIAADELPDYDGRRFFTVDADLIDAMSYDAEVPDLLIYWMPKCFSTDYPYAVPIVVFYKWDSQNEQYVSYGTKIATLRVPDMTTVSVSVTKTDHNPAPGTPASGTVYGYFEPSTVSVSRRWPEKLTGIFADSNRLWGWEGRTLRASKLGDAGNWAFFDGTAEDSWALEVQTPEEFTGGISAHGYPTFYTPRRRYRVYGSEPEAYQLAEQDCQGVKAGCAGSMAVVNGAVFFVSEVGIMADDGTGPELVSAPLGSVRLQAGSIAVGNGWKYLISGLLSSGGYGFLILDVRSGTWIRETSQQLISMANVGATVYAVEKNAASYKLWKFNPSGSAEGTLASVLETNDYTMEQPNRKRVHRIQLRLAVANQASVTVSIRYDGAGSWVQVAQISGAGGRKSVYLPVLPKRCDTFALRFEGSGVWELQSLALETRAGSAGF